MTDTQPRGLHLDIYRNANGLDCTLGGITATVAHVTLVGYITDDDETVTQESVRFDVLPQRSATLLPPGSRVFPADANAPAVLLRYSPALNRRDGRAIHLIPADLPPGQHSMAGGNYAATTDSRLGELLHQLTGYRHHIIPVHDRIET